MARNDSGVDPRATGGGPAGLEERLRTLEERLRELQERQNGGPQKIVERLIPPEARAHLRAAQRERLLAMRAVVDAAIKRFDERSADRPRRAESVKID